MGQAAKLKAVKKAEREARKGTLRLQSVQISANFVAYDEHGRATAEGSGTLQPFFLMEAEIPGDIVAAVRAKYPDVVFVTLEPPKAE